MQKNTSGIMFCILLIASVFTLGYLIGSNHNTKNIEVTYSRSSATSEKTVKTDSEQEPGLIDINTANQEELEELPEIGEEIASRIIKYRETNGAFNSVEDLLNVEGIGKKTFAAVQNLVTVGG